LTTRTTEGSRLTGLDDSTRPGAAAESLEVDGLTGWIAKGELCTAALPVPSFGKISIGGHDGRDGLAGMSLGRELVSARWSLERNLDWDRSWGNGTGISGSRYDGRLHIE
jgi:hypothetical protein